MEWLLLIILPSLFLFWMFYYGYFREDKEVKKLQQKLKEEQDLYIRLVKIRRRHRAKLRRKTKIMYRNNINF